MVNDTKIKSKMMFIEGVKLCTESDYIKYNVDYYKQVYCIPLGGCISENLAGLIMNKILDSLVNEGWFKHKILIKYLDDIFCVAKNNVKVSKQYT